MEKNISKIKVFKKILPSCIEKYDLTIIAIEEISDLTTNELIGSL